MNNKCYDLEKGEGFLIYPGESTYYKADNENPWEYCLALMDINLILF